MVPADEPHEWAADCWCLPVWDNWIEAFGSGAYLHNTQDGEPR
jgi:hypothetical protein